MIKGKYMKRHFNDSVEGRRSYLEGIRLLILAQKKSLLAAEGDWI